MWRRWIIRSLFILPVLLCLAGRAWSGLYFGRVEYCHDSRFVLCEIMTGTVVVEWGSRSGSPNGWDNAVRQEAIFWDTDNPDYPTFLGFSFSHVEFRGAIVGNGYMLAVPFWFLILASSAVAVLFVSWRMARPKGTPGGAFPVEVSVRHE